MLQSSRCNTPPPINPSSHQKQPTNQPNNGPHPNFWKLLPYFVTLFGKKRGGGLSGEFIDVIEVNRP